MLKATLYVETKSTLPLQTSENSEADLGFMPHLGCKSCAWGNSWEVKTSNYCHKELGHRCYWDPESTSESYNSHKYFSTKTPPNKLNFFIKLNYARN